MMRWWKCEEGEEGLQSWFFIVVWVKVHDILGYFCILKGAYHSLPFSLPHTTVFQYLRGFTYVSRLFYYMIYYVCAFHRCR